MGRSREGAIFKKLMADNFQKLMSHHINLFPGPGRTRIRINEKTK